MATKVIQKNYKIMIKILQNACRVMQNVLPLYQLRKQTQKQTIAMRAQVGKYYFGRHRSNWGIWQWECVTESGCAMARFVKDVYSYEDAVKEVYSLNGWGQPKQIRRIY